MLETITCVFCGLALILAYIIGEINGSGRILKKLVESGGVYNFSLNLRKYICRTKELVPKEFIEIDPTINK